MRERHPCTYIMASRSRTLYVGVTSNLESRVFQHRNGKFDGFASTYQCHRLVWFEKFGDMPAAIGREKQIKRWSRGKKIALIEETNRTWEDLSAEWVSRMSSISGQRKPRRITRRFVTSTEPSVISTKRSVISTEAERSALLRSVEVTVISFATTIPYP
jgi:putative endonuclease